MLWFNMSDRVTATDMVSEHELVGGTMTLFRCRSRGPISSFMTRRAYYRGKLCSTSTLASLAQRCGPWYHVDR